MDKTKVLFITQAIDPFMEGRSFAELVKTLAHGTQESGKEIRVFMPRFGVINERRHQLHEVIRLSGMNLIINDSDHPLIIKVASIPQARMQVYFIDNDEFFKRKEIFHDRETEEFCSDNADRALFFSRGVLETVKKLGWTPDLIHCNGWMTGFTPLYLKTMYADDPHFNEAKIMYTSYNENENEKLDNKILDRLAFDNIDESKASVVQEGSVLNLNKLAIEHADAFGIGAEGLNSEIVDYANKLEKPTLAYQTEETLVEKHQEFYTEVLELNEVMAD
ncbi:glycogen/starch synthase [Parvicella tangerina]|uniref:starch synthase n=1 Tax=Parvicella tangerina TaxID=2829795 RepID=A0A916NDN5_9FLAO|nr:glycogen/starch synthase [Parvicella tangerina]CAG5087083.1 Glycogen synthase [Parvicella tangerina]